jgi:hypothetical protein
MKVARTHGRPSPNFVALSERDFEWPARSVRGRDSTPWVADKKRNRSIDPCVDPQLIDARKDNPLRLIGF